MLPLRLVVCCLSLDSPRNTNLSPCGGTVPIDSTITVSSEANPPVSSYQWIVNGIDISVSSELIITEEMFGTDVEITCIATNEMRDGPASDSETCIYTIVGSNFSIYYVVVFNHSKSLHILLLS